MNPRITLFTAIVLLAACSKAPEPAAPAATPAAPAASAAPSPPTSPSATSTRTDVALVTSTPATIRSCEAPKGRTAVTLNWDLRSTGAKAVTVKVGDRVVVKGGARGKKETGNWVRKSSVFTLSDAATNTVLATLQIPFVDC